jgi:hypothetical protein
MARANSRPARHKADSLILRWKSLLCRARQLGDQSPLFMSARPRGGAGTLGLEIKKCAGDASNTGVGRYRLRLQARCDTGWRKPEPASR